MKMKRVVTLRNILAVCIIIAALITVAFTIRAIKKNHSGDGGVAITESAKVESKEIKPAQTEFEFIWQEKISEGNLFWHSGGSFSNFTHEIPQTLRMNGKEIVYFQGWSSWFGGEYRPYVVVPGYKTASEYRTEHGMKAIKVRVFTDDVEKETVRKLLAERVKGPISFWTSEPNE